MIIVASMLAAGAALLAFGSGYLFGARRGRHARLLLAQDNADARERLAIQDVRITELDARIAELKGALVASHDLKGVTEIKADLRSLAATIHDREQAEAAMKSELRAQISSLVDRAPDPVRLERDLRRIVTPLLDRERDSKNLREMMETALAPFRERDRVERELSQLDGGSGLGELPRLLDAIAEKASLSSVILSDDVGLPLAASAGARSVEWLAGMSSLLLTLVERAERSGEPKPIGIVVHDDSNQMILHRIFTVGKVRFLLTAVSRGHQVSPAALDPALAKLERALARPEAVA